MSEPKTARDKAKSLLKDVEMLIVSCSPKDSDLSDKAEKIADELFILLRTPFVDESELMEVYRQFFIIRIEKEKRNFENSVKKESDELILDKNENISIVSKKDREKGEESFYDLRGTAKEEEEYLFIKYKDKKTGKTETIWIEVGKEESESSVYFNPGTICGILKKYDEIGEISDASLYHNHPLSDSVFFSYADLISYAAMTEDLKIAFPKQNFTYDFRVITIDGMFILPPMGFDIFEKFVNSNVDVPFKSSPNSSSPLPAMFVLLQKRGKEFSDMLSEHGIPCTFQLREEKKNPVR